MEMYKDGSLGLTPREALACIDILEADHKANKDLSPTFVASIAARRRELSGFSDSKIVQRLGRHATEGLGTILAKAVNGDPPLERNVLKNAEALHIAFVALRQQSPEELPTTAVEATVYQLRST